MKLKWLRWTCLILVIFIWASIPAIVIGCKQQEPLGAVGSSLLPMTNATYNVGSSTYKWLNGYFSGTVNVTADSIGTSNISDANISRLTLTDTITIPLTGVVYGNGSSTIASAATAAQLKVAGQWNAGSTSIPAGSSNVSVTHGLASTPTWVILTYGTVPTSTTNSTSLAATNLGPTNFSAGSATYGAATIYWIAGY